MRVYSKHAYWWLSFSGVFHCKLCGWQRISFLISSAVTVSSFGGPGLSSEQAMKYLIGNLAGLPISEEKTAFNYLTHTS